MNETWLIAGGNGQLGRALRRNLAQRGINYFAPSSRELDIRCNPQVLKETTLLMPNVIVNAAAWTDVDGAESDPNGAFEVNVQGALNLALAAKSVNAVYAYISSDYVFSGNKEIPWKENDLQDPISIYGKSKANGEVSILNAYKERSYVFRTAWLYSPWGRNFVKTMTKLAINSNHEVKVVNDQFGQPTSAIDLANQIIDTISLEIPFGIYHATNSGQATWFEFAKRIFELSEVSTARLLPISSSDFQSKAVRPKFSILGHESWENISQAGKQVPGMRDWKSALAFDFPEILMQVRSEMSSAV